MSRASATSPELRFAARIAASFWPNGRIAPFLRALARDVDEGNVGWSAATSAAHDMLVIIANRKVAA